MMELFTPSEVAKRLNITTMNVYNLIKDGQLKAYNSSNGTKLPRWKIKEEDLLNLEYTKYKVRNGKISKIEKIVIEEEIDVKAELAALKEDLLSFLVRIEELEQKL